MGESGCVRGYSLGRAIADRLSLQVMLKTYYSPIPDLRGLPTETWSEADPMRGIDFDLDAQVTFLKQDLAGLLTNFAPDGAVVPSYRYEDDNPSFPLPDTRTLFALVRRLRPRRLWSSFRPDQPRHRTSMSHECTRRFQLSYPHSTRSPPPSTRVCLGSPNWRCQRPDRSRDGIHRADQRRHSLRGHHPHGQARQRGESDHSACVAATRPRSVGALPRHTSAVRVPPLPLEDYALYWSEQYLLQAFLCLNPSFEVRCAVHALCRDRPEAAANVGLASTGQDGVVWIRRKLEP